MLSSEARTVALDENRPYVGGAGEGEGGVSQFKLWKWSNRLIMSYVIEAANGTQWWQPSRNGENIKILLNCSSKNWTSLQKAMKTARWIRSGTHAVQRTEPCTLSLFIFVFSPPQRMAKSKEQMHHWIYMTHQGWNILFFLVPNEKRLWSLIRSVKC